jgi:hypothetical protein
VDSQNKVVGTWTGLVTQDRIKLRDFVETLMNLWFPLNVGNLLTNCGTVSSSRRALVHGVGIYISEVCLLYTTFQEFVCSL